MQILRVTSKDGETNDLRYEDGDAAYESDRRDFLLAGFGVEEISEQQIESEEIVRALREGEARNAADPHGTAYWVPVYFADGQSRCNCGWVSKVSTPGRANAAHQRHAATAKAKDAERAARKAARQQG